MLEQLIYARHCIIYNLIIADKPVLESIIIPILLARKTEIWKKYYVHCSVLYSPGVAMFASEHSSSNLASYWRKANRMQKLVFRNPGLTSDLLEIMMYTQ